MSFTALQERQPLALPKLRAALASSRRHHAFLLTGADKRRRQELAAAVGKSLICSTTSREDIEPCATCPGCQKYDTNNHPDAMCITPNEKGRITVDTVREMSGRLALRASEAPTKVVLILEADAMNAAAQNALLKTLEEPPGPTCFLLCAQKRRGLLPTIRSRAQLVQLSPANAYDSWKVLHAAGLDEALSRALSPWVGDDVERANVLADEMTTSAFHIVSEVFSKDMHKKDILEAAADLGSDKDHAGDALKLLEVMVRDQLALAYGAHPSALYGKLPSQPRLHTKSLHEACKKLSEARKLAAFNPNRTMQLEGILLSLTAQPPQAPPK